MTPISSSDKPLMTFPSFFPASLGAMMVRRDEQARAFFLFFNSRARGHLSRTKGLQTWLGVMDGPHLPLL